MKNHSSQMLSCALQDTKTVILLENFLFGLNNYANMSETFLLNVFQCFLFFHKSVF